MIQPASLACKEAGPLSLNPVYAIFYLAAAGTFSFSFSIAIAG